MQLQTRLPRYGMTPASAIRRTCFPGTRPGMPALPELHVSRYPFDLSPCVVDRLARVGAQRCLPATAGYFSGPDCLKNRRDVSLSIDIRPAKPDKLRVVGIASANARFSQPACDAGCFLVGRAHDVPAIEGLHRVDNGHPRLLAPGNTVPPHMVRVGKDKEGPHPPCNIDGFHHIQTCGYNFRHPEHEEMPLLRRDLDTRDNKDRG